MRIMSLLGEGVIRALLVFTLTVFIGVSRAFAGDYDDADGPPESTQPAEAPPAQPRGPEAIERPCYFGPITMRIDFAEVETIIRTTETRRAAWNAIVARADDPEAKEITFAVSAPDDGLGDGLVCPGSSR